MSAKLLICLGTTFFALLPLAGSAPTEAQPSTAISLKWEVKSRFRLFKNEDSFRYLAGFYNRNGILASETALAADTKGDGWARKVVGQLCVDDEGQLPEFCSRDYSGHDATDRET